MWWYGRGNGGGSWLQEEKKANMWHGRGNSDGSWPPAFPRSLDMVDELKVQYCREQFYDLFVTIETFLRCTII